MNQILLAAIAFAGVTACVPDDPVAPPDPELVLLNEPIWYGKAGWDPVRLAVFSETTWSWVDTGSTSGWVASTAVVPRPRASWEMQGPEGQVIPLTLVDWPEYPNHRVHRPTHDLTPGIWYIVGNVDGKQAFKQTRPISDHGQTPVFGDLDRALFELPDGLGLLEPPGLQGMFEGIGYPLHVRLDEVSAYEGLYEARIWAPGKAGLCRAWTGNVVLDDQGRLSSTASEITVATGSSLTFTNVGLSMGLAPDGESIAGIAIDAGLDTRQLDALITEPGADVDEGKTADLLRSFGFSDMGRCSDNSPTCLTVHTHSGTGRRINESIFLDADPNMTDWHSLDDAQPCGGPNAADSPYTCSVIGTAGLGTWFVGIGAILFRRRRIAAISPDDATNRWPADPDASR